MFATRRHRDDHARQLDDHDPAPRRPPGHHDDEHREKCPYHVVTLNDAVIVIVRGGQHSAELLVPAGPRDP
jgi:hypothetical protein